MYKSTAQQRYFHANPEKVGGAKVVKEFDQATKSAGGFKKLPKKKKKKKKKGGAY